MHNPERNEPQLPPDKALWNTQLERIQTWSFEDWMKPDRICPEGQAYLDKHQVVDGHHFNLDIRRFHNSVRISILESSANGNPVRAYSKLLFRYNPTHDPEANQALYTSVTQERWVTYPSKDRERVVTLHRDVHGKHRWVSPLLAHAAIPA